MIRKIKSFVYKMTKVEIAPSGTFYPENSCYTWSDETSNYEGRTTYEILNLFEIHKRFSNFKIKNRSLVLDKPLENGVKISIIY